MLRARREAIGMSLSEAAETTNIRARVLATFEAGDYAHFPAKGYTQGMLSSYARLLGLDPREVLSVYEGELAEYEQRCEIARNAEYARRGDGRFGMRKPQGAKPVSRGRAAARQMTDEREKTDEERRDAAQAATEQNTARNVKVVGKRNVADAPRYGRSRTADVSVGGADRYDEGRVDAGRVDAGRASSRRFGRSARAEAENVREGSLRRAQVDREDTGRFGRASRDAQASGAFEPLDADASELPASDASDLSSASPAVPRRSRLRHSAFEEYKRKMRERDAAEAQSAVQPEATPSSGPAGASRVSGASGRLSRISLGATGSDEGGAGLSDALAATDEEVSAERDRAARRRSRRQRDEEERELRSTLTRQQNFFQMLLGVITSIFSERRTRLIAIAAIFLVVAVVLVAVFLISTAGSGSGGVIQVQGGARDDSVATQDAGSASATVTTTNGNPVSVSIVVEAGQTSLVNVVYDDDKAYSGTAVGPWNRSFQVTESMEATFGNPDAVKVTENGQEVQVERQEDGTGKLSLSIQTANAASAAR